MVDASVITALLGPTNTGKTHRATERMLEHDSGMIGLPLRLLAREVYDKVSAKVGEAQVALVTGEEQRIPARPSYWVSTVEAMPVERDVDFVAVDEIQLAEHDQRGHVFTSRILSARGRKETWLLGAGTMRKVLSELAPTARIVEHPRLSRLSFAGSVPLARLPPRSAVVAFSMSQVYEIAERLRIRKGGAAVVLGALSPRTRNAQVAMFQAGEVDYLVATDAIGMGLNLGVGHVAFAALRKFDGHEVRALEDAELGQIAGRAGRWIENGTFGTLAPLDLSASTVSAIEEHRFPSVTRVRWRNDRLDFSSLDALGDSLAQRPTRGVLRLVGDAEDTSAFLRLSAREDIVRAARGEAQVRLLWDVCTIPDFRKLLLEVHVELLADLFLELVDRGTLGDDWIAEHVRGLDDMRGDVETLVARIASTRTWTYVANRTSWLTSPARWNDTTRDLEDRLSEALHTALVTRFVDVKRSNARPARPRGRAPNAPASTPDLPPDVDGGHPFARLAALRSRLVPAAPSSRQLLDESSATDTAELLIEAPHEAFRLEASGHIVHVASARVVAEIVRGVTIAQPDVRLVQTATDDIGAGARSRLQRRLVAFARDVVGDLLGDVRAAARRDASTHARGLLHHLEQGLGTTKAEAVTDLVQALDAGEREALVAAGLVFGQRVVWLPRGLLPSAFAARIGLASAFFGLANGWAPKLEAASFVPRRRTPPAACTAIGFPLFGKHALRADTTEPGPIEAALPEP
jgi:ATP-dependent RNA helicase SUPV3L1/SUV3